MCNEMRCLFVFIGLFSIGYSANILISFPFPSKSQDILGGALGRHLVSIGHNITYISAYENKNMDNFLSIRIKEMDTFKENMKSMLSGNVTTLQIFEMIFKVGAIGDLIFEDPGIQHLVNSDSKFDLMIPLLGMDASMGLAHHFDVPVVVFIPTGPLYPHDKLFANPALPSYITTIATPYTGDMTFFQRVTNTIIPFVFFNAIECVINYFGDRSLNKYLPSSPPLSKIIEERVALMLLNSDISTESPRPYVPNMIQIGGFHLQKPEPLNENLKKVLDDATDGFIYLSFGTNVIVKGMDERILNAFKKVLGNLPYKVVIKYEDETMPNQPRNFHLGKWFPQPSVLNHPNIKLFISHGGYGGTTEALYYGVPLVCIPFMGDQSHNCANAEYYGYSVTVNLDTLDEESFGKAVNRVLYDQNFKNAIKFKSELYRNQPMNPMDKAVFWIEHVIKHKGAEHLKVKGAKLPWYQYYLIDVFAFLGLVISVVTFVVYKSCKFCCKKMFLNQKKIKTN